MYQFSQKILFHGLIYVRALRRVLYLTISHCSRFSRAYTGIFLLHAFRNYEDTKTSFDIHRRRETQQPDDYQVLINEDANDNGDTSDNMA